MIAQAVHVVLLVVLFVCTAFRYLALRRNPGDRATRAVFTALLFMLLGLSLGFAPIFDFLYRLTGSVPGALQLVQHLSTMSMAFSALLFTLFVVAPDTPLRWRTAVFAVSAGLLVALYFVGPLQRGLPALGHNGHTETSIVAYVSVWQLYTALAQADLLRLVLRNRSPKRDLLRTSLTLIAVGCALLLVQAVHKLSYLYSVYLGHPPPYAENGNSGIQIFIVFPAGLCFLAGLVLPSIGAWRTRRRLYRALEPLASAVGVADVGVRSQRARLLNRVIGIRDALVGPLRPHLDTSVYAAAMESAVRSGLDEESARACAEAACIDAALHGDSVTGPPPRFYAPPADEEAAWLAKVSEALTHHRQTQLTPY